MQLRYRMITNDGRFIEMFKSDWALTFLKGLRKRQPDLFKYQRITEVIQAQPSKVIVGILHTFF